MARHGSGDTPPRRPAPRIIRMRALPVSTGEWPCPAIAWGSKVHAASEPPNPCVSRSREPLSYGLRNVSLYTSRGICNSPLPTDSVERWQVGRARETAPPARQSRARRATLHPPVAARGSKL